YELLEHLLGNGEVGDYTVFHGPYGIDVAGNATKHLLSLVPDSLNDLLAAWPAFLANGNNRRFIEHDTFAPDVDQGVGCTEVDCHIAGEITAEESEHGSQRSEYRELGVSGRGDALQAATRWQPDYPIKQRIITYNWRLLASNNGLEVPSYIRRIDSHHFRRQLQSRHPMAISEQDVMRIAQLARIQLSPDETAQTQKELNDILGLMARLRAVDTEGVEPMAHPLSAHQDIELRLREDV